MSATLLAPVLSAASSYLATKGMDLLSSLFRGGVDKGVEKIAGKIKEKTGIDISDIAEENLSDKQLVELKQFELDYQEMLLDHLQRVKALEVEEEKVHHADRVSARSMQIEALRQNDKIAKYFIYAYSFLITCLTFGYIFYITMNPLLESAVGIADTVLGFLLGVTLSAIIQFFYGSSKGSSDKNSQLSILTQQLTELSEKMGVKK
ncbi:hypothetical protein M3P05_05145 [Sansalvadorimonas sp. 2012CJ34-2]|uniref:Uncharacterized protein n=1 Tax=Parendozoicomonas callyspongiae TaxID=2942213 RepID=A0ABT0PD81_9GAMM|nr:hypothetical protein [Sansalvadorimonas sp. 2012CJ34-2]MCL6269330.1 hypothetical protein [Sansalvadorimonas sp. 2012CJ34-2]